MAVALFGFQQYRLTRPASPQNPSRPPPLIPVGLISWKRRNLLMIYLAAFCNWAATDVSTSVRACSCSSRGHVCLRFVSVLRRSWHGTVRSGIEAQRNLLQRVACSSMCSPTHDSGMSLLTSHVAFRGTDHLGCATPPSARFVLSGLFVLCPSRSYDTRS